MTALETIKNQLIDRIMLTKNEELLKAIAKIFESTQKNEVLALSSDQIEMLRMSERDIELGNLTAEEDLD